MRDLQGKYAPRMSPSKRRHLAPEGEGWGEHLHLRDTLPGGLELHSEGGAPSVSRAIWCRQPQGGSLRAPRLYLG
jgi:hypothetical protein